MLFLLDPYPHHMIHMHVFRVQTCILSGSMGASDMHHNFFCANEQEEKQPSSGTVMDYDGVLTILIQQSRYISINFSQDFLESVSTNDKHTNLDSVVTAHNITSCIIT